MNELRLILILIGIAFLIGLYLISRRFSKPLTAHQPGAQASHNQDSHSESATPQTRGNRHQSHNDSAPQLSTSHFLDNEVLRDYADDIDWDNLDDIDLEWLEDSLDRINYDQIMYELNQGYAQMSTGHYLSGYGEPSKRGKVFISMKSQDAEKMHWAVNSAQKIQPLVLVLHILAGNGRQFAGEQLQKAMKEVGMQFGEMNLFHYYADPEKTSDVQHKQRIFSAANTTGSGAFHKEKLATMHTPGITLLLQLPTPIDQALAFETWYQTAKSLADKLGGTLFDVGKNRLTKQALNHMQDQVSEYGLKLRFDHSSSIH